MVLPTGGFPIVYSMLHLHTLPLYAPTILVATCLAPISRCFVATNFLFHLAHSNSSAAHPMFAYTFMCLFLLTVYRLVFHSHIAFCHNPASCHHTQITFFVDSHVNVYCFHTWYKAQQT